MTVLWRRGSQLYRIAERGRGGRSENRLAQARSHNIAGLPCRIELPANEIVSASNIETVVDS
jgi:hypothetical protein